MFAVAYSALVAGGTKSTRNVTCERLADGSTPDRLCAAARSPAVDPIPFLAVLAQALKPDPEYDL